MDSSSFLCTTRWLLPGLLSLFLVIFLFVLLPLLLLTLTSIAYSSLPKPSTPSSFIKSSCSVTLYPTLCISSLSTYSNQIQQSPKQLAQIALAVSYYKARSAKAYVIQLSKSKGLKRKEYKELRDCVDNMGDSVERLNKAIGELGHMG
ncbi:pectinesterase inhibitor domain-containing protein, partial [Ralstonia pseudosolanacearum]|uniref:pectinesterase inhibitor domain-containing protein n=1 Tax=Ralstonia pseudosolanacearum TaxID=1310165 RepID=UPI003CED821F